VAGSQVTACLARGMRREGPRSARRYASFEDVQTKFIAAIKAQHDASCRAQSEGVHAGAGRAFGFVRRCKSGSRIHNRIIGWPRPHGGP
jgi:hypothetical protein